MHACMSECRGEFGPVLVIQANPVQFSLLHGSECLPTVNL